MTAIRPHFATALNGDSTALRALTRYVHRVGEGLGVGPESTWCELGDEPTAYVALEQHRGRNDMALVWDVRHGWAAVVETHSGEDMLVLAYFGPDPLPVSADVVAFTKRVLAGEPAGQLDPPVCAPADFGRLRQFI
ncbi:hypothetical protein EV186_102850 [Labedaea rhizosphaerae]|uniref:DUF6292 domain-containing protein n=1 Tax=Labedaea rhizosphaerae TaxID=598644 RepID=A0A4R6SGW0_LABRH|nr:hypothetical protein EV186_102850 [Labedaea rhizosphaerae]